MIKKKRYYGILLLFLYFLISSCLPVLAIAENVIIIDPQYGGKDHGPEISDFGAYSKDITLDISMKLRDIINKYDKFTVILLREKDVDLSTEKRVELANRIKGDIFISIGINTSKDKTKCGLELITAELKFDKKAQDNKSKMSQDMNAIINDLSFDISRRHKIGAQLAKSICEKAKEYPIINGCNILSNPLDLLLEINAPSTVVMVGYVSNKIELGLLLDAEYQNKIAMAIFKGIKSSLGH